MVRRAPLAVAVDRIARSGTPMPGGGVDADLVGAAGLRAELDQRPPARSASLRQWVIAGLPFLRRRSSASPSGRLLILVSASSIVPSSARASPASIAEIALARPRAPRTRAAKRFSALGLRASSRQPEVSVSSRWTGTGGRWKPSRRSSRWIVQRGAAGARPVHRQPAGLVDHQRLAVFEQDRDHARAAPGSARAGRCR